MESANSPTLKQPWYKNNKIALNSTRLKGAVIHSSARGISGLRSRGITTSFQVEPDMRNGRREGSVLSKLVQETQGLRATLTVPQQRTGGRTQHPACHWLDPQNPGLRRMGTVPGFRHRPSRRTGPHGTCNRERRSQLEF